jgi:hypothetical protein
VWGWGTLNGKTGKSFFVKGIQPFIPFSSALPFLGRQQERLQKGEGEEQRKYFSLTVLVEI